MSSFWRPSVFHFAINFTLGKPNNVIWVYSQHSLHIIICILSPNYKLNIVFVGKWFLYSPVMWPTHFSFLYSIDFSSLESKISDLCSTAIFHVGQPCTARGSCNNFKAFVFRNSAKDHIFERLVREAVEVVGALREIFVSFLLGRST